MDSRNQAALSATVVSSKCLRDVCEPFFKEFNFNYFRYLNIPDNNLFYGASTNPDFNNYCINNNLNIVKSISYIRNPNHFYLLEHGDYGSEMERMMVQMKERFDYSHVMFIVEKSSEGLEVFVFGSTDENCYATDFYIYNMDIIKTFILYIKEKIYLEKNINQMFDAPFYLPALDGQTISNHKIPETIKKRISFFMDNEVKRFFVDNDTYLTPGEVVCIGFLANGFTAKMSPDILGITKRTYEAHLYKIRQKLECHNNLQIMKMLCNKNMLSALLLCAEHSINITSEVFFT